VAGFQGIDQANNITDARPRRAPTHRPVALGRRAASDVCEIYTDVDGVYTTDPRSARRGASSDRISYEEMLELASLGAKVLADPLGRVREPLPGARARAARASATTRGRGSSPRRKAWKRCSVSGVAYDKDQAKITLQGVPDIPGPRPPRSSARCGGRASSIDMIVQNVGDHGRTDITFTVHANDLTATQKTVDRLVAELGVRGVSSSEKVGKVSVVGLGMRNHAGVAARMFDLLASENINIQMISTSEIKISVVVDVNAVDRAVNVLHKGVHRRRCRRRARGHHCMKNVDVYDTTLRDGTQGEGVNFTVRDKLAITEKLDDLGVRCVEGGWPGSNPRDAEYFARRAS
jgi:aspartate kinase